MSDTAEWWIDYITKRTTVVLAHPLRNPVVKALVADGVVKATRGEVVIKGLPVACTYVRMK